MYKNGLFLRFLDLNNSKFYDFCIILIHFVPTWVKSAEVKKLKPTGYLRAKLDITNRLLFKPIKHKNQFYLLVLEVIRNHHYSKSRFLQGEKIIEEEIVFNPVETDNTESLNITSSNAPVHLLNKFIIFDEQQKDALQCKLPLIVIGSAGSGKTSVTLEKLKGLEGKILYIRVDASP